VAAALAAARTADGAREAEGRDSHAASVATADMARKRRRVSPEIDSTASP
jgi:hypothetical protein